MAKQLVRGIFAALIYIGIAHFMGGCVPMLLLAHSEIERNCPLPAYMDSFGELTRSGCASDAQWARAVAQQEAEDKLADEYNAKYDAVARQ